MSKDNISSLFKDTVMYKHSLLTDEELITGLINGTYSFDELMEEIPNGSIQ